MIRQANTLLANYSNDATDVNFNLLNQALPGIRDKITEQTELQAGIMCEYAACGTEAVRKAFLDTVLAKDSSEMRPLFDQLLSQITLGEGVDEKFKHRFLASVLQSSKFATGAGRVKELVGLLGERKVVIDKLTYGGPKAGLEDFDTDNPKSEKLNARDPSADAKLLKEAGGNLAEFVKAKRGTEAARVENPKKTEIRNVTVLMDSSQQLLPVYYGLTPQKQVQAYTSPMFTAVHHELGHVVNALKGKGGRKADKYTADDDDLLFLTDEEELENISLDRYSDKAFTDEIGLPERIAHHAFTGLDAATPQLNQDFMKQDLQRWDERTYKVDEKRLGLLRKIKSLVNQDWSPYTLNGVRPAGVTRIANALAALQTTRKGVLQQLNAVRQLALGSHGQLSVARSKTTSKFYEVVATMKFNTPEELAAAHDALAIAWSPMSPAKEAPKLSHWTPEEARRVEISSKDKSKLTEFPRSPAD